MYLDRCEEVYSPSSIRYKVVCCRQMALLYGSKRILERSNHLKYTCNLYSQHQYVLRTWNVQKNLPTILVSASYELRSPGHFVQLPENTSCKRFVSCTENLVPGTEPGTVRSASIYAQRAFPFYCHNLEALN